MSVPPAGSGLRIDFERLLEATRRRVHRYVFARHLRVGILRSLTAMLYVAGACLLVRIVAMAAGRPDPVGWTIYCGTMTVAVVLPLLVAAVRGRRDLVSWREAAERLDLGVGEHNRVAIALALVDDNTTTAFGGAAVHDGIAQLRKIHDGQPYRDPMGSCRRQVAWLAASVVALTVAAWWIGEAAMPTAGPSIASATPPEGAGRKPAGDTASEPRKPDERPTTQPESRAAGGKRSAEAQPAARSLDTSPQTPAAGKTGGGSAAKAQTTDRSARTAGESADTPVSSPSGKPPQPGKRPTKSPKESKVAGRKINEAQQEGSAVSQGSSGGGTMSPVEHSWSQREQSVEGDREEQPSEEDVLDESQSSQQRGGIQPMLKDRNEAPSNDLSISGEEGPPGTGRGGPTPPKKSRGTASLVLGVPIPDFVRGRVGPGTTKITHERVEPSVMPGDPAQSVEVRPREVPEGPCPRFAPPPGFFAIVREYLVALHSSDQVMSDESGASRQKE